MTEFMLGTLAAAALGVCVIDCFFWQWGGRKGKWKRRYIGAAIQTLGLNVFSVLTGMWHWTFTAAIVPEIGSRVMGYGADSTEQKILRRSLFALGSLLVGVFLAYGQGFGPKTLALLACQLIISVVSVVLGVKNPLPAAVEEVFLCMTLKYFNYTYIFVNFLG